MNWAVPEVQGQRMKKRADMGHAFARPREDDVNREIIGKGTPEKRESLFANARAKGTPEAQRIVPRFTARAALSNQICREVHHEVIGGFQIRQQRGFHAEAQPLLGFERALDMRKA